MLTPLVVAAALVAVPDPLDAGAEAHGGSTPAPLGAAAAAAVGGPPRTLLVRAGAAPGGDGSEAAPFADVQRAVDAALPGDTISVGPGRYAGRVTTVRPGTADAPIRIVGEADAHLFADGQGRLLHIAHDHVTVAGLQLSSANIVVLVTGASGVRLEGNWIHGAGSECVRLRAFASANVVVHNTIRECGLGADGDNAEAIYVGTAPEKRHENPTPQPDRSVGNLLWGNDIIVRGECIDIKEDADANQVIENWCRGGRYASGAGLSSRAQGTVFVNNWSTNHLGSGLQLAGDRPGDAGGSVVTGNTLIDNAAYGLKIVPDAGPQLRMCGNVLTGNGRGPATPAGAGADTRC